MRRTPFYLSAGLVCAAALLAGCSGGAAEEASESPSPSDSVQPVPMPTPAEMDTISIDYCVGSNLAEGPRARVVATVDGKKRFDKRVKVGQAVSVSGLDVGKRFVIQVNGQTRISGTASPASSDFYISGKGCPEENPL